MIYISVAIFFAALSLLELLSNNRQTKQGLLLLAVVFLIAFTGLRSWGGTDLDNYRDYYINLDDAKISYGFLYEMLNRFALSLGLSFTEFLILIAVIVIPSQIYFFYKTCAFPVTALFVFYILNFIWLDHILLRQSIASVFVLSGVWLLLRQRKMLSVTSFVVAGFFHASALIAAMSWVAMMARQPYKILVAVLVIALSLAFFHLPVDWSEFIPGLSPNIGRYLVESESVGISNVLETAAAIILFQKGRSQYSDQEIIWYSAMLWSSVVIVVLSFDVAPAARFLEYARLFFVVIFVRYIQSNSPTLRPLVAMPIYVYGLAKIYHFCVTFDGGAAFNAYL
ncbi:MAG TPA: EpsG family protein [Aromatoleum sp.]|uniref:EpsG family protein n=1 Tax=Aromatoleum sp. TaxID=2307007 RepID=UPI002B461A39|nr:EpsG family protein [Aromatoleum sp.]HJV25097.1 EpsG family protein [Aromatoleum sp.]